MFRSHVAERERIHEKARRHVAKGDLARAIGILKGWLGGDREDDRTLLKLADLHRRAGEAPAAAAAFAQAAELYSARGFTLKAAAALRQAAALAPDDLGVLERLGEINAELGLAREAAILLEQAAAAVERSGDAERLVALRRRILLLLPSDPGAALRLADLLAERGEREEPVRLLERAAESWREPGQHELWMLIQERLVALQPENAARGKELARVLLAWTQPRRALAILKPRVAADPADAESLSLLGRAFELLGQVPKAAAAWREVARTHRRGGRAAEARPAWERVLELLPGDAEAAAALAPPVPPSRAPPSATLADELAEADFLAEHGAGDEARAILLGMRERFPGAAEIAARLAALDAETVDLEELVGEEEEELVLFEEQNRDSTTAILERARLDLTLVVAEAATREELEAALRELAPEERPQAAASDPDRDTQAIARPFERLAGAASW